MGWLMSPKLVILPIWWCHSSINIHMQQLSSDSIPNLRGWHTFRLPYHKCTNCVHFKSRLYNQTISCSQWISVNVFFGSLSFQERWKTRHDAWSSHFQGLPSPLCQSHFWFYSVVLVYFQMVPVCHTELSLKQAVLKYSSVNWLQETLCEATDAD